MKELKIKSLEEAEILKDKTLSEIKRDFKIETVLITILVVLALIICFKAMELSINYEALKQEKETYKDLAQMQNSMIADLEENCNKLYIELEEYKSKN